MIDGDIFTAGNLVRHTLQLDDIGMPKATALAHRLNSLSPQADVHAVVGLFPPTDTEALKQIQHAQVIMDCTADDEVIAALSAFPWQESRYFASASLGWKAQRLWMFGAQGGTFPADIFSSLLAPWVLREREEYGSEAPPREGIGCWHSVFPARADDIWLMATLAVKQLEKMLLTPLDEPTLWIWEQGEHSTIHHVAQTFDPMRPEVES